MELREILDRAADRVATEGTYAQSPALRVMEAAAREVCPGAAAALIDWNGSEVARLRAFGVVHAALLRDLPADTQRRLAVQLAHAPGHELAA